MKLLGEIYNKLINLPEVPPESGGIIGSKDGVGVALCEDVFSGKSHFSYSPNVRFLNNVIEKWAKEEISLYAIYHTHVEKGYGLSEQDKDYIDKILRTISDMKKSLYFPIVIPNDKIVVYKAIYYNGALNIEQNKLIII